MKHINIWDLDGTVINSFHRVQPCLDSEGNLDLGKYKDTACKHSLIMQDSLLPLVELMRSKMSDPDTINYIVTARLMRSSDYYFLRKQQMRGRGMDNIQVLSRDTLARHFPLEEVKEIYGSKDAEYKGRYFDLLVNKYGREGVTYTVYDDHKGVLAKASEYGFNAIDATQLNDMLDIGYRLANEELLDDMLTDDLDIDYLNKKVKFAWDSLTSEEQDYYSVKYPYFANAM